MKKFNVFLLLACIYFSSNAQPLNSYILQLHGAGCDNQSGILVAQPVGGTGTYSFLWSNGSTNDTAFNLSAGIQWLKVFSGTDSVTKNLTIYPWGLDTINVVHACNGSTGSIYLNLIAQSPIQYLWYDSNGLMANSTVGISNLLGGTYSFKIIDADGCSDSGSVSIVESSPQLYAFTSDSVLCYGQSAQVWYTPGFTVFDNWGVTYNSSTDTIIAQNYMNMINYPTYGVDSFGCSASLASNNVFAYLQPHPNPVPLYQFGDTISISFMINQNPSATDIYTWSIGSTQITSGPYSYLPIDSSGNYNVSILNQWGCTNFGSIQAIIASLSGLTNNDNYLIRKNPIAENENWILDVVNLNRNKLYFLIDAQGHIIDQGTVNSTVFEITSPKKSGMYYLNIDGSTYKLIQK
jgi:hypothetical protein